MRQLLTHRGGYPRTGSPSIDLYHRFTTRNTLIRALFDVVPGDVPELDCAAYTDFDFMILGILIERVSGLSLATFAERYIFGPLDMRNTMFCPSIQMRQTIAPTEFNEIRGGLVWGDVHDEHAWRMDGVAGHAGLFSNVVDLAQFCDALLDGWISPGLLPIADELWRALDTESTRDSDLAPFSLGWMLNAPFMGTLSSVPFAPTLGHTGFTGTSIVVNRTFCTAVVLLTNRVYPHRDRRLPGGDTSKMGIRRARIDLCDAVVRELSSSRPIR